jgi:putative transposase
VAGQDRMTVTEVVRQVLHEEHGDVIRESVRAVAQELMNLEVSELIGAELGERTEDRATHRNGYRPRRWDTRAGEIELQIPKIRQGSYFPSFCVREIVGTAGVQCGVEQREWFGRRADGPVSAPVRD